MSDYPAPTRENGTPGEVAGAETMNIAEHMRRATQQLKAEGYVRTLAGFVMNQNEFGWIEGAMRRAEARHKIGLAIAYAIKDVEMQRDVMCEKLNEYIDKTKAAEERAPLAERQRGEALGRMRELEEKNR